jgi:hypothetical protein
MTDTNIKHRQSITGTTLKRTEDWEAADAHVLTPSIADDAVVTVDDAAVAENDMALFSTVGVKGVPISGTTLPESGINGQVFLDSDLPGAYIWIP